ncbi:uncharacterized protein G2W53_011734 [Senna tora]|uniref:Uncharacterized protein n=1 Tax=Senna tora TaxID=362788 RepID=A0A834X3A7_9FABA|nr:uncharacterized protein G2W53_011734 [Senna tora]
MDRNKSVLPSPKERIIGTLFLALRVGGSGSNTMNLFNGTKEPSHMISQA